MFRIARNPDGGSTLPFLLWVPLRPSPLVLKAKETWPRTGKVYCHPNVPIVFCETRPLAQEWAYRFLGAARRYAEEEQLEL